MMFIYVVQNAQKNIIFLNPVEVLVVVNMK
jgi:hypothetical protein